VLRCDDRKVDKISAMPNNASQLLCIGSSAIKTKTLPPLRVTQALRASAEAVLDEAETLSSFVLDAPQGVRTVEAV
jgi:hypothetical protein